MLCALAAALLLPRFLRPASPAALPEEPAAEESSEAAFSPQEDSPAWLLAERAGRVAVYCEGKKLFVTEIEPRTLRSADRELLRRGIEADSMEDILMLIEDLNS